MIAHFLVVHGSRNPSYLQQLEQLQELIMAQLISENLYYPITIAYLELGNEPLRAKISRFATKCYKNGCQKLKIFPLFLLSGTHVLNDIPEEVEFARLSSPIDIELMPHLGKSQNLITLLADKYQQYPSTHRILVAHGTKRSEGNQESEAIAQKLKAVCAYCSISPSLSSILHNLLNFPCQSIAILPYFLFAGKITDAIADQVKMLQMNTSNQLIFIPPLGVTPELVKIIINQINVGLTH